METAWLEAQQGLPFKAQPLTICAYQVDLAGAWEHMASRGIEPPSWRLTKRLVAEKCAGIVVPSFAPGAAPEGRNIVFWKWSSELPHKLTVIDEEARLPRNTRSWEL
jgi:RES domain-containing protein